jgi:hypothetical protein
MEETLYYKMLKLTNGDTVICKTDDSCINLYDRSFINIVDPVKLNLLRIPKESSIVETYILIHWISFIESDILEIPTSHILVTANPRKELIHNYNEFIMYTGKDESDEPELSELEDNSDTEEILDQMLNELQRGDINGEDEDDGREENIIGRSTRSQRMLH